MFDKRALRKFFEEMIDSKPLEMDNYKIELISRTVKVQTTLSF